MITTDNGMEFSTHEIISKALGVEVFVIHKSLFVTAKSSY